MGPLRQTTLVSIADLSQVALARRTVQNSAQQVGFDSVRIGQAEIIAVELATNLLNHASGGTLLINAFVAEGVLEILSVDNGPGMADLQACLADGFSTGTTPGLGLGSVQRLSQQMDVYSWPGKGTVIAAKMSLHPSMPFTPGVVCAALEGEPVSGDRWATVQREGKRVYLLVDGLGHGSPAAAAAEMAVDIFLAAASASPTALIEQMHGPMRSTRGAAVAIAAVDPEAHSVLFSGIGNISASLQAPGHPVANLVSHNGTVGHVARRVQPFQYPWTDGSLLIMHSDGIATRWSLGDYPGLAQAAPSVIAGILFRDFRRQRDDATVMVVRLG